MAWTAPRTFVTAEIETAAIFNTHLRDNLTFLKNGVALSTTVTSAAGPTVGTTELVVASAPAFTADGTTVVEVSYSWFDTSQTVPGDTFQMRLYDGASAGSGTQVAGIITSTTAGGFVRAIITPTAGAHTYTARLVRTAGTGTASVLASSTAPAIIAVGQFN